MSDEHPSQNLSQLYSRLDQQDALLREIKTALIGDAFGNKGLVGRADICDSERAEMKVQIAAHDRKIWFASIALSFVWAAVLSFKEKIFK